MIANKNISCKFFLPKLSLGAHTIHNLSFCLRICHYIESISYNSAVSDRFRWGIFLVLVIPKYCVQNCIESMLIL